MESRIYFNEKATSVMYWQIFPGAYFGHINTVNVQVDSEKIFAKLAFIKKIVFLKDIKTIEKKSSILGKETIIRVKHIKNKVIAYAFPKKETAAKFFDVVEEAMKKQ